VSKALLKNQERILAEREMQSTERGRETMSQLVVIRPQVVEELTEIRKDLETEIYLKHESNLEDQAQALQNVNAELESDIDPLKRNLKKMTREIRSLQEQKRQDAAYIRKQESLTKDLQAIVANGIEARSLAFAYSRALVYAGTAKWLR